MNPVISAFGETTPISVERRAAGSYSEETGRWVPGALTTLEIAEAAVLPAKESDMRNLPEGMEKRGAIIVYTTDEIKTVDQVSKIDPDVILYRNRRWQAHTVEFMAQIEALTHYRTMAIEEDRT